ncbi:uncharacterized protein LOC126897908 [Daktulosphaira vitifoliae]|uniref:uncharacterized protein LOC126897908 n=1 Tax=Daktulosphaira vitifoliae TaxID=58002 RepID=UPI0021A9BDA7|nr:uncharacterized protein LOC126897908 [Daktulosphaira vitifoliae]
MEGHQDKKTVTVPGVSETPGPAGESANAGLTRSLSSDCGKTVGLLRQGPGGVRAQVTAGGCGEQASSGVLRDTEVTAGSVDLNRDVVDEWSGIRGRFCNDIPMSRSEFDRWSNLENLEGVRMECFPHGGFRSPADFRSSVTSILRMMRDDLSAGVGFSPERVIPYNPFEGIEEEEERANLMSRCVSALRGGSDTATDRVVQATKLALSEILSRHMSNPTLVAAGTGLGDAVDAYEYASWLAQKESASGYSPVEGPSLPELVSGPNTDEDDVMRTGHGPGGEEAEPSLGEEGASQKRSPALSPLRMETPPKRHPGKRRAVVREDESDDEETFDAGLNHLVSLSRAAEVEGSLMKEVPNTHLAFLLEQIALSCQALTELRSSAEPRWKRRNDTAEEMTATPTMVNEVADQVRVLRGVIDKRRGMGVHREVQEATKKLEAVLEGERRRKPSSRVGVHQAPPDERAMLGRVEKVPTKEAGTQTEHPEAAVSASELSTGVAASNTLGESAPDGDLPPTAKVVKRVRKRRRKKANGRNDGEAGVAPQSQTAVAAGVPERGSACGATARYVVGRSPP